MRCQARILGEEYTIQGTDVKCHTSGECSAPSVKKITVDDGDACFHICAACFRRFLTKSSKKDTWIGWFDCAYPPHARVTYSAWYHEVVRKAWDEYNKKQEEMKKLDEDFEDLGISSNSEDEILQPSKKDVLKGQIAEIETWMKGEGRLKFKEQPKKLKELMRLRAEIKML
jgi:hypothetical protein